MWADKPYSRRSVHPTLGNMKSPSVEAKALVAEAEMLTYVPATPSYACRPSRGCEMVVVPLQSIEVLERAPNVANFHKQSALSILEAVRTGTPLPPIEISATDQVGRYKLYDGFHRYHLSRALGFTCVPAVIVRPPLLRNVP